MNNPSSIREASAVAARISLDTRDPKRALAQLGSIRGTTPSDWRLFDLQSEALMAMGRLADAELAAKRSVALLDQERKTLAVGPLRSAYLANRVAPFARLIALHIRQGDTTSAFLVAATVPGRTFAERVNQRAGRRNQSSRDDKGESILRRIHAIETQTDSLDAESGTEQRESLSRALESARAEYEGHLAMTGGAVQVAARSPSLTQIQSQLAPDQAAIVFVSGPERLDCFVVRRNQLHYWAAPISDGDLLQRVRVVRAAMEKPGRGISALNALGQLHDLLIAPAVSSSMLTGSTRLAMVLHGPLTALPTAALWNRKTRRFLIQDVELSYLPSVSALAPRDGSSFSARLAIFAPFPDSLPGSVIEARSIARLIPKSTIRIGASARERDVRAAITSGFSLHIASHGIHNVQNPLFSSVSVGRDRGNGSMDDGRLELHEIADLTTTSPLIFLSGCETAVGTSSDGRLTQQVEGGSLSEAFLAAGARLVIATLWRVDDRTAVRIAQLFYRQLQLGRTPQRALAIAQRDEINKASDFTWAAYQVSAQNPPTLP